jgi:hypothetical protein
MMPGPAESGKLKAALFDLADCKGHDVTQSTMR